MPGLAYWRYLLFLARVGQLIQILRVKDPSNVLSKLISGDLKNSSKFSLTASCHLPPDAWQDISGSHREGLRVLHDAEAPS